MLSSIIDTYSLELMKNSKFKNPIFFYNFPSKNRDILPTNFSHNSLCDEAIDLYN
jgi:hypothetical protein